MAIPYSDYINALERARVRREQEERQRRADMFARLVQGEVRPATPVQNPIEHDDVQEALLMDQERRIALQAELRRQQRVLSERPVENIQREIHFLSALDGRQGQAPIDNPGLIRTSIRRLELLLRTVALAAQITPAMRAAAETAIEGAMQYLDQIDPPPPQPNFF